jgi:hypothetical protein
MAEFTPKPSFSIVVTTEPIMPEVTATARPGNFCDRGRTGALDQKSVCRSRQVAAQEEKAGTAVIRAVRSNLTSHPRKGRFGAQGQLAI